jgi:hypothetical protein
MSAPNPSSGKHDRDDEKKRQEQSRRQFQFGFSYLIASLVALWLFQPLMSTFSARSTEIPYSEFKQKLADAQIVKVTISTRSISGEMKNPKLEGDSFDGPIQYGTRASRRPQTD